MHIYIHTYMHTYIMETDFKEFGVSWERETGKQKENVTLQERQSKNVTQVNRQSGEGKHYLWGWRLQGWGGGSRQSWDAVTPGLAFEHSSGAPRGVWCLKRSSWVRTNVLSL